MNPFQTAFARMQTRFGMNRNGNGTKALTIIRHPTDAGTWTFEPPDWTGRVSYPGSPALGLDSSVVVPALTWLMRTFPEAPPIVEREQQEQWHEVAGHPMTRLLRHPNPYYGGRVLLMATIMDFAFGNAYWLKVRNAFGEVVQLWWVPRALMQPKWPEGDSRVFISHYDYQVGGQTVRVPVEDVVHFRFGMDPLNLRLGFSQLSAVMREVYTDEQASTYTAAVLKNLGVIGVIVAPKEGAATEESTKQVKEFIQQNFTGERRGQTLALSKPTDVTVLQYNLQGLDLGPIRDVSEERVCAALGLPAAVVGFGTGLQQTKVGATMRELIQLAWKGAVMPNQEIMADELDRSLLPEFQTNLGPFRTAFDATKVRALWEDVAGKHDRVREDWSANLITQAEARRELGYPVDDTHNVYQHEMTALAPAPSPVEEADTDESEDEPEDDDADA